MILSDAGTSAIADGRARPSRRSRVVHRMSRLDRPALLVIALIVTIGLVNLYSATSTGMAQLFHHQLVWLGVGAIVMVAAALYDYRGLERSAGTLYGIGMLLLVAVLVGGRVVNGSRRWFGIGALGIQPSELMKLGVIILLGRVFATERSLMKARPYVHVLYALGVIVAPVVLIAKQPDLGTALIVFLIGATMFALSPLPRSSKVWTALSAVVVGLWLFFFKLHDYQKRRLLTFIDPALDPSGAGWHSRQAVVAVGSGGMFGKGWMKGTQNQLQFLPEHWTDFPFAVWAEEWGFLGSIALVALYLWLVLWMLRRASAARDRFGEAICTGCAALVFWHVFFNVGMVIGVCPVVGVTLPLFSYGGSSLLTIALALGILQSVSARRFR